MTSTPACAPSRRVFVAGYATESNTFAATPTGLAAWQAGGLRHADGTGHHVGNFALVLERLGQMADTDGVELAVGLMAFAQPAGPTPRAVHEALRDELLADLRAALPVHAVVLLLHGAMVAEGCDDCEGDLIEAVRAVVGLAVSIGVELDLHCHFTERTRRAADIVIAYKEYPHTDVYERLAEVWRLTLAAAAGHIRPVTAVADCAMVGMWHTTREPLRSLVDSMAAREGHGGVLSISFGHGFPYADVPEAGAKVWVVADGDAALAARVAAAFAQAVWQLREQLAAPLHSIQQALDAVAAAPQACAPLVLADVADNPGAGCSGDSSFILQALLGRGIGHVAIGAFWDLGAVQLCCEAGVGARLAIRVGGKCGPASGAPVDLVATVQHIAPEHYQSVLGFSRAACGTSVWLRTDEAVDLVLISLRQQVYGTDLFTGLGIELQGKRAIVVKSMQHFHADFAPLASQVLYVDTAGAASSDFARLAFVRRSRDYWPRVACPAAWKKELA